MSLEPLQCSPRALTAPGDGRYAIPVAGSHAARLWLSTRCDMIVCSCNVLSDKDVRACVRPGPDCPRTASQVYACLGCSPQCGRCARTIRDLLSTAREACGEPACPRASACGGRVVEAAA